VAGYDLQAGLVSCPINTNLSDVAAVGVYPLPLTEGRCIPRFQVYRMSAQTDRLLGVAFDKVRSSSAKPPARLAPWSSTQTRALGFKTFLDYSTRTGSRSSPRVGVRLTISAFLSPRTDLPNAAPLPPSTHVFYGKLPLLTQTTADKPNRVVRTRQLLLRRFGKF
jgi:hypothetical protein